jgi:proteasome lid subunit RPN8/RPN11
MTEPSAEIQTTHAAFGATRDASALDTADWPFRAIEPLASGERSDEFQVVTRSEVIAQIHAHGQSNTAVEVAGVLVGNLYKDSRGPYLHIRAAIPAEGSRGDTTHVTFTAEAWTAIHKHMDQEFPDDRIVGWYHTHPDFGIFLSEMDFFIQKNFFDLSWQVAFVYDPIRHDEGMFVWRKGGACREPILIERASLAPTAEPAQTPPPTPHESGGESYIEEGSSLAFELSEADGAGARFWMIFLFGAAVLLGSLTIAEWLGITR